MRILSSKKLYLPALSIVAVVFLLLVLVSISTYRNLDREKTQALHFFYRQGVALLRSIEAGARTGMKSLMWQEMSLRNLLQETAKDTDIAYVYLVDEHGKIVHRSDRVPAEQMVAWKPVLTREDQVVSRIRTLPAGSKVYELAKFFAPMYEPSTVHQQQDTAGAGQIVEPHFHRGDTIVLGMKMTAIEAAQRADIQHAVIMAAIVLVLGSGTLFFIFVIQNYYLVGRTLKQTEDYTRQVVANMANGLLSINPEGRSVSYNLLALELLGLEESKIQGLDLNTVIDFKASGIARTLSEYVPVLEHEIYHRKESGTSAPLALSATPICDENGNCDGAVIILRDLSEIKQLQQRVKRSEKLAAIGELAAGVAHEIRNPLSSIRGFAQFLKKSLHDKPKEQEYAQTMVNEVDRINRVVTDLLTFARPMQAILAPTDVTELVEHSVRLVQADAESRQVDIQIKVADLTKLPIDANQMTQALLNLLLNALQAVSPGGHVDIGAELNVSDSRLHFWVEDDGPGIAKDKLEKIFEPFFTMREQGTGLGLSIVHKIVENHSGEIMVACPSSGKVRGCRFTIRIPTDVST